MAESLALEDEDEEKVEAVERVEKSRQAVELVVARDPRDELEHPDDAHHQGQLDIQVEPKRDLGMLSNFQ